ncbi:polymorphic toxin-type HINT domain-containing protein [Dactylosporangium sp. CS-033363]|uniref:polymorphic toxin-type HINT domain-containing protein n=1 Tax=Dactylosporangium sp. CS-033363 TaxID=3239935 RepID=UPI003D93B615
MPLRQRLRAALAGAAVMALVGVLGEGTAFAAPAAPPALHVEQSVPGGPIAAKPRDTDPVLAAALHGNQGSAAAPAAAGAETTLTATARTKAGALPLAVGAGTDAQNPAPSKVRVEFLDTAATARTGIRGPVWRIARADGGTAAASASVELDYTSFRNSYGGDWAQRLHLVRVPECALSTPAAAACRPVELPSSRNDTRTGKLTADVALPAKAFAVPHRLEDPSIARPSAAELKSSGALFAAVAGASGPTGSFAATSLSPSSTWSAGNPTGNFGWSYPLRVPPGLGGPTPSIALSYSSSSVDGRSSATNNQPSMIGEGFDFHPGFIERRYKPCAEDMTGSNTTEKTGDQCWATDNATMSLNGSGGELVRDDATGAWKLRSDDGSKIERFTGATNGDDDGEYWKVTTTGGMQYFFGRNRLPGWSAGKNETNSTWTSPVYGNQSGEPCYKAGDFAGSSCQQAYRWQLDEVIDPYGNAMSYWYEKEGNLYAANLKKDQPVGYTRGGWLKRAEYGQREDTLFSAAPVAQVVFDVAERCVPGSTCDYSHPENYPDTPLDQKCDAAPCDEKWSPTFWTTKRYSKITTQVSNGAGGYRNVDSWTLHHEFPSPGDGTRAGLWLEAITHTGHVGGDKALPEVNFDGVQLTNRVMRPNDTNSTMNWWRVARINNESGGQLAITYSEPECSYAAGMPAPESNTKRCMPVKSPRPGSDTATDTDWFHKYVVKEVTETDRVTAQPPVVTRYEYSGNAAWRLDDNDGLVDPKYKTYGQWRGYPVVRTLGGATNATPTVSETRYFQGMNGDKLPGTNTFRSVSVSDSFGGSYPDEDEYAGMPREVIGFGPGGAKVSSTITDPWRSDATATRNRDWGNVTARRVNTNKTVVRALLSDGTWRTMETSKHFDSYGTVDQVEDRGDVSTPDDDQCTRFTYARNTGAWILNLPTRTETVSVSCAATPSRPADVLSDALTLYDNQAYGAAPTKGAVTETQTLRDYTGGQPVYYMTGKSTVDGYGRGTSSTDALGWTTTTAYTPEVGGPVTQISTKNPLDHVSSVTLEPAWGLATKQTDANTKFTELEYDPLGRLAKAWAIDRPRLAGYGPISEFGYTVEADKPIVTSTKALGPNGAYVTTYDIFDGLQRPRQTQVPAPGGGRIVTDTVYDNRGFVVKQHGAFYNDGAPGPELLGVADNVVPGMNVTEYDAAGRPVADAFYRLGVEQYRTTTQYRGERTTVIPPYGVAATTVKGARGETLKVIQHAGLTDLTSGDETRYTYTKAGQLETVTDPMGTVWTNHYDRQGRLVKTEDPDKGTGEIGYNDAGQVTSTKDARGTVIAYAYDKLGRLKTTYDGSTTGAKRTENFYDPTGYKGLPNYSVRYLDGAQYITGVRSYDAGYRPLMTRLQIVPPSGKTVPFQGAYDTSYTYNVDGSPASVTYPNAGGDLDAEQVRFAYNDLGLPTQTYSALGYYAAGTDYTKFSEIERLTLDYDGPEAFASKVVAQTFTYKDGTRRLDGSSVYAQNAPALLADVKYDYDGRGLISSIKDTGVAAGSGDTQCFTHDNRSRLTEAWTPTSGTCAPAPSATALGGPAPYWNSWTYDKIGSRQTETQHTAAGNTQRRYKYDDATKPHSVTSVEVTEPGGTVRTMNYGYDQLGDTINRLSATGTPQTLTWGKEGELSKVVEGGDSTEFVYDAGGNRIIRKDAKGATLYLGGEDLRLATGTTKPKTTRYYTHAGQTVAVRDASGLSWTCSDHLGTNNLVIKESTQDYQVRRTTPFGQQRGTAPPSWPTTKGYLGGEQDPTGLTHLGAREYDPALGRFISVDPEQDFYNPQMMQGYSYANNSPVSSADPSGRRPESDGEVMERRREEKAASGGSASTGGSNTNSNTGGVSQEEVEKAKIIKDTPLLDIVIDAGGEILMEVLGINDIRDCFTKGDILACVGVASNFIPWAKIAKLPKIAKAIERAYKAYDAFKEKLAWAKAILRKADDAAAAAEAAAKKADDVAEQAAKHGDDVGKAADDIPASADDAGEAVADTCNSFLPGTPVLMADGSTKPIETLQIGDQVVATDPETGATGAQPVTTTIKGTGDKDLVEVTVADASGTTASFTATDNHPIWVASVHEWRNTADLRPGDSLLAPDGSRVSVLAVAAYGAVATVHNLTVEDTHTYYVLAGPTAVLVHNSSCDVDPPQKGGKEPHEKGDKGVDHLADQMAADGHEIIGREFWARAPGTGHTAGNIRRYDLITKKDGIMFFHESKNGAGATYNAAQRALDKRFSEVGLILYGRGARAAKVARYYRENEFVIMVHHFDV